MLKKITLCALVLCLLLGSTACDFVSKPVGNLDDKLEHEPETSSASDASVESEIKEEPTEESSVESTGESTVQPYTLIAPAEAQIALLVANRDQWYPVENYYVPYSYAVADLDQNGRLELLITVCMGTGFFSENAAWEVNATGDGIVSCGDIFDTYESQVDLGYAQTDVYYDGAGIYYYMVSDYIRNGWAFNATEKYALSLQDGQLQARHLASYGCENFEDGSQSITCYDASGAEISQEEYEQIEATVFAELIPMTASFLWQAEYLEDTDLLDADGWHSLLEESWAGFSLE